MIKKVIQIAFLLISAGLLSACKEQSFYEFTTSPIVLPSGTNGSAGKHGTYVLFGDWPQTIKAKNVKVDEARAFRNGCFIYYLGDDGNFYVKASENAYNTCQSYSDKTYVDNTSKSAIKKYKYFKVEPIKWRLITKNYNAKDYCLLVSEVILESGIPYYDGSKNRQIDDEIVFANNYEYSVLREWLNANNGFYGSAFDPDAQKFVLVTEVDNSPIQMSFDGTEGINPAYSCPNTFDKVFLPGTFELVTAGGYGFPKYDASYGENPTFENGLRIRKATDYALARGVFQSLSPELGGAWWLRSPSYFSNYDARFVLDTGKMRSTDYVFDEFTGVVPAICIKLN